MPLHINLKPVSQDDCKILIDQIGDRERYDIEIARVLGLLPDGRSSEAREKHASQGILIQYYNRFDWGVQHHKNVFQDLVGSVILDGVILSGVIEIKTTTTNKTNQVANNILAKMGWNTFSSKKEDAPSNVVMWYFHEKSEIYHPWRIYQRDPVMTDDWTLVKEY